MREHAHQFDEHPLRAVLNPRAGLPVEAGNSKVRKGKVGGHKVGLGDETSVIYDRIWDERIAPVTGHLNYEGLRAALAAR